MITKVEFIKDGKGYIKEDKDLQRFLYGKSFEFSKDKINIIFGPNGSGKSTIIKAIAGNGLIDADGYYHLINLNTCSWRFRNILDKEKGELDYSDILNKERLHRMKNEAIIEDSGTPIYYYNFKHKVDHGSCGDLQGDLLKSTGDELTFYMAKQVKSDGETQLYLYDYLVNAIESLHDKSMKELNFNEASYNQSSDKAQFDFFSKKPDFEKAGLVLLLDEYDENLDLNFSFNLLKDYFPSMQRDLGVQIILTTHNPIILSDYFYNSDKYNVISMDPDYTEDCRTFMYKLFKQKS